MTHEYTDVMLLNMCMIEQPETDAVLLLDKKPKEGSAWCGITFPGGHIEPGESLNAAMKREILEETGLEVTNLKQCGLINWHDPGKNRRHLIFLYKTKQFTGTLLTETEEGRVFWCKRTELPREKFAPDFALYLNLFFGEAEEAYALYSDETKETLKLIKN